MLVSAELYISALLALSIGGDSGRLLYSSRNAREFGRRGVSVFLSCAWQLPAAKHASDDLSHIQRALRREA